MSFFDIEGLSKRTISCIFILKIIFGISLWAVYTFYYTNRSTADIYKYFDDSKILFDALKTNPVHYFKMLTGIGNNTPEFNAYYNEMHYWARKIDSGIYNDSHTIIRLNAFVRIFSFGYYNIHTVFICFLSLTGLTAIYKTFIPFLQNKKTELLFAVFLLPSVLFWGSGVLKEGLIFFALGLLIYYTTRLFSIKSVLICIVTALLLAFSKFYVWLAIIPGIFLLIWLKQNPSRVFLKFALLTIVIGAVGLNIDRFTSIQNPLVTLSQKQMEFKQLADGNLTDAYEKNIPKAGSSIPLAKLEPTFLSFVKNSPKALFNTLFRPFIWESRSPFMILAGTENIFVFLIIISCIVFIKPLKTIKWEYVLLCLSFVIIQFLIIGVTTPVLGAIARYKTIALPFFLIAFLLLLDKDKLIQKLPFVGKILRQ